VRVKEVIGLNEALVELGPLTHADYCRDPDRFAESLLVGSTLAKKRQKQAVTHIQ